MLFVKRSAHFLAVLIFCAILSTSALPSLAVGEEGPAVGTAIPADATLFGRVDFHTVLASPLGSELLSDLRENYENINWFLGTAFGFDLDQVDLIWFVSNADGEQALFFGGTFNGEKVAKKIKKFPGWKTQKYTGVPQVSTFKDEQGVPKMVAVLRDDLLAVGDHAEMEDVLEAWQGKAESLDLERAGVKKVLGSSADIAATVIELGSYTMESDPEFSFVEDAWIEGHLDENLLLSLEVEAVDPQVARGFELTLEGLLMILARHPEVVAEEAYLQAVEAAKIQRDGKELRLTTTIRHDLLVADPAKE